MTSSFFLLFASNLAFADLTVSQLSAGDLVISEIMHDPVQSLDYRGEWIELYNNSGDTVNLNGLILSDITGESITINSDVTVAAGSYALLAARSNSNQNGGMTNVDYQYSRGSFRLNNADAIILSNAGGTTIDSVTYNTVTTFPSANGTSLTLSSLSADNSLASSWCEASSTYGVGDQGTPGAANDSCGGLTDVNAGDLIITEIMPDPTLVADYRGEWFEIYNTTSQSINLNGLELGGSSADPGETVGSDIYIGPGEYAVFAARVSAFDNGGINNVDYQYNRNNNKLYNNGDILSISYQGVTLDSVTYIVTAVGGEFPSTSSGSLSLASSAFNSTDNNSGTNWCSSVTSYGDGDLGTPGTANDSCSTVDNDGDGVTTEDGDCDDNDAAVFPGAPETCDGTDNNCSGDEDDASDVSTFFFDQDDDGFGDANVTISACTQPTGYVTDSSDCDDTKSTTFPGADELCDGEDNDCDQTDDNNPIDGSIYYTDGDSDGYGDADNDAGTALCSDPNDGRVTSAGDCDDSDPNRNPGAAEIAGNGVDDNCDGEIDGLDSDNDGDGFTPNQGDCNDSAADEDGDGIADGFAINPNADEVCDSIDNNCDNTVDEATATDATTWYDDVDADGFGDDQDSGTSSCDPIPNHVANNEDCDDSLSGVYPGVQEDCSTTFDDNCDGSTNDLGAANGSTFYVDADGDGFGEENTSDTVTACTVPSGYSATQDDCNDDASTGSAINPSASEICDSIDNDCDGLTDGDDDSVDATTGTTYYADKDVDLWGDPEDTLQACSLPAGYRTNNLDCDDRNSDDNGDGVPDGYPINPWASEVCDGIDNDCDNLTDGDDDNLTNGITYYADTDGDGFGDPNSTDEDCSLQSGFSENNTDCDDNAATTFPGSAPNESDASACYADADGDDYGDASATGNVTAGTDCDDAVATTFPGATETAADGIDSDCSNTELCFVDSDGDGFGTTTEVDTSNLNCDGTNESGVNTDCDDAAATTFPGAAPNESDASACYADADGDDYGDASASGNVTVGTDCDDAVATTFPGAAPNESDASACYADADGDDYGDASATGNVTVGTDCLDSSANTFPGAAPNESDATACYTDEDGDDYGEASPANGVSAGTDCDDNDANATNSVSYTIDIDGDGHGDGSTTADSCTDPGGSFVVTSSLTTTTDCDDNAATTFPGSAANESDASACYADADGDDYGDASASGNVTVGTDCDDAVATTFPGAAPNESDATACYADADGDDYGDASATGNVTVGTDCLDSSANTFPGAAPNESDAAACYTDEDGDDYGEASPVAGVTAGTDCDDADANATDSVSYTEDADGDGHGDGATTADSCSNPGGNFVVTSSLTSTTDCDDAVATTFPGSAPNESDATACYADADGDDYGDASATGNVTVGTDCLDSSANTFPGAAPNESDATACYTDEDGDDYGEASPAVGVTAGTDCDDADSNATSGQTWYQDDDEDGYGVDGSTQSACTQPTGFASDSGDCNDSDDSIFPGAPETCNDGIDSDCDEDSADNTTCSGDLSTADAIITGENGSDVFGYTVSHAGDLNADGTPDMIIGARNHNSDGAAYVFYGPVTGTVSASTADAKITGVSGSGEAFGIDMSGGLNLTGFNVSGDINGDNQDDLIVGALRNDDAGNDAGAVYIFYGPVSGSVSASSADATLTGGAASDLLGRSVTMLGDVNGDTIGDFLVTAYKNDFKQSDSGRAYLFYGSSTSPLSGTKNLALGAPPADVIFDTYFNSSRFGTDVAPAGDLNGDGNMEILIGAEHYDKFNYDGAGCDPDPDLGSGCNNKDEGAVFVWYGTTFSSHRQFDFTNGNVTTQGSDLMIIGENDQDRIGYTVHGAGDVNGDGTDDLLIGAPYYDGSNGTSSGAVYVISGTATGVQDLSSSSAILAKITGTNIDDQVGRSVGTAGDLNADGNFDILVGAKRADENGINSGATYVFLGPVSGTVSVSTADSILAGESASDEVGTSAVTVGDVDGNGTADFLIGSHHYSAGSTFQGAAYLIHGEHY